MDASDREKDNNAGATRCCYHRGRGKVFYFRPGHETLPIYYQTEVLQVITNAAGWAAPAGGPELTFGDHSPLEKLD